MGIGISPEALQIMVRLPANQTVGADELGADANKPAVLKQMRNLMALGLVLAETRRPLRVRLSDDRFAHAIHGLLRAKPFLAPILADSHLPILAALSSKPGSTVPGLANLTGLHAQTVRRSLRELMDRALIRKERTGYAIADHAGEVRDLAGYFVDHELKRKLPQVDAIIRRGDGLTMLIESKHHISDLPATGARKFQDAGADVLAANFQYRIHALKDGETVDFKGALADAVMLGTAPATLRTMQQFLLGQILPP